MTSGVVDATGGIVDTAFSLSPLNATELGMRLNMHFNTVRRQRDKGDEIAFAEWSKEHDLDGVAWQYHKDTKKFHPVT